MSSAGRTPISEIKAMWLMVMFDLPVCVTLSFNED